MLSTRSTIIFNRRLSADYKYGRNRGSDYDFLNRSPRPGVERIRKLIEYWFSHIPDSEKDRVASSLRSKDNFTHSSALFELYCHELLLKHGFSVSMHRIEINSRAKDFRAQLGSKIIEIEATVCTDADALSTEHKLIGEILDYIDEHAFATGFRYSFEIVHSGLKLPKLKKLAQEISIWSRSHDRKQLRSELIKDSSAKMPVRLFTDGEWKFEIMLLPRPDDEYEFTGFRQSIGVGPVYGGFLHHDKALRNTLGRKAKHYQEHSFPYIIAVDTIFDFPMNDDIDILQSLLGSEQISYDIHARETKLTRKPDGLWIGPNGPWNKSVSAVLLVNQMKSWTICTAPITLYLNPWATNELASNIFKIDTLAWELSTGKITKKEGQSSCELFGLEPGWPNID